MTLRLPFLTGGNPVGCHTADGWNCIAVRPQDQRAGLFPPNPSGQPDLDRLDFQTWNSGESLAVPKLICCAKQDKDRNS